MLFRHLMLLFNQRVEYTLSNILSFQNISCYCLTVFLSFIPFFFTQFQNISCYCLTRFLQDISLVDFISKHLMLLFNFISTRSNEIITDISKHLMLLFNIFAQQKALGDSAFQNISCYCLTFSPLSLSLHCINFKTSHVIV